MEQKSKSDNNQSMQLTKTDEYYIAQFAFTDSTDSQATQKLLQSNTLSANASDGRLSTNTIQNE